MSSTSRIDACLNEARSCLTDLAAALGRGDADGIELLECDLAELAARLTACLDTGGDALDEALTRQVSDARWQIECCRRLGQTFGGALLPPSIYRPDGRARPASDAPAMLEVTG